MIKLIISFIIVLILFSCKEFQNQEISSKIDNNINKIEKIIENKKVKHSANNQVNRDTIFYHVGEPYFIEGVQYIPEENYKYSEVGLSTFYGKELHNVKTVNNDFNKVTELLGRHKTLPIPSMVKITNLDNGLSINIKIVDRHKDNTSIIQVSRKVAQLLGFYKEKIATVRVEILSDSSKQWKSVTLSLNEPNFNETISSAPTEIVSISNIDSSEEENSKNEIITNPIELSSEDVEEFQLYLKILNFENYNIIQNIMNNLEINLNFTSEKNGSKYDLIIGPLDNKEINNLVPYFISKGYKETKIILN